MDRYVFKISFNSEEYIIENIPALDPEGAYMSMYAEYPDAQIECIDVIKE